MWSSVMCQARVSSSVPGGPHGSSRLRPCGHQQVGISQALRAGSGCRGFIANPPGRRLRKARLAALKWYRPLVTETGQRSVGLAYLRCTVPTRQPSLAVSASRAAQCDVHCWPARPELIPSDYDCRWVPRSETISSCGSCTKGAGGRGLGSRRRKTHERHVGRAGTGRVHRAKGVVLGSTASEPGARRVSYRWSIAAPGTRSSLNAGRVGASTPEKIVRLRHASCDLASRSDPGPECQFSASLTSNPWTSADFSGLDKSLHGRPVFGSTIGDLMLSAAGVGFEPTSDLNDHCRFVRQHRSGSTRPSRDCLRPQSRPRRPEQRQRTLATRFLSSTVRGRAARARWGRSVADDAAPAT